MDRKTEWLCIQCGKPLGRVFGSEYYPNVPSDCLRTSGPNLTVTCPDCGSIKVWYTSDPVVRAVYQLTDAMATVAARSMMKSLKTQNKE